MIDLSRETPVTLDAAPALLPAINAVPGMDARKPLCSRTIYNWATKGNRGVILETVQLGGIIATTREAIARFFDELTARRERRLADKIEEENRRYSRRNPSAKPRPNAAAHRVTARRLAIDHNI